jgi:LmbE family N-acetylglucosaminyl deacetylase
VRSRPCGVGEGDRSFGGHLASACRCARESAGLLSTVDATDERTSLMITVKSVRPRAVVALGAHCDDIAIGAGGTLLFMCQSNPRLRVDVLVLSGGGTEREDEERAAMAAFCPSADLQITVLKVPDGRLPAHWEEAKEAIEDLRAQTNPDLLFAPNRFDAHQDHRALAKLVPTAFRDHLVLGYEIVKWDGDLGRPNAYQALGAALLEAKVELLQTHYQSQRHRPWYDREAFLGLSRIRGVECGARYAEAFHVNKIELDLSGG